MSQRVHVKITGPVAEGPQLAAKVRESLGDLRAASARSDRLLKVPEVAAIIGISPNQLYIWARAGKIPHVRINGRVRFRRNDLEAWLDKNTHQGPTSG